VGMFRHPGVPTTLDAINPRELLSAQRAIDGSAGERPPAPCLFVFEWSRLRRNRIGIESEPAVAQLATKRYSALTRLIPEDSRFLTADCVEETGALIRSLQRKRSRLVGHFYAHHDRKRLVLPSSTVARLPRRYAFQ